MSYQRIKCPNGHSFMANVYSRYQRIECPDCKRASEFVASSSKFDSAPDTAPSASFDFTPSVDAPSSDTFSSGGGGDFGGGGSSGSWD